MSGEKTGATKAEVHHLLKAKFIEPVAYPTWLANVVMVQKKNEKWRMCIDFTNLKKHVQRTTSLYQESTKSLISQLDAK
jgi:hypothetical protein